MSLIGLIIILIIIGVLLYLVNSVIPMAPPIKTIMLIRLTTKRRVVMFRGMEAPMTNAEKIAKWESLWATYVAKLARLDELRAMGRYGYQLNRPKLALKLAADAIKNFDREYGPARRHVPWRSLGRWRGCLGGRVNVGRDERAFHVAAPIPGQQAHGGDGGWARANRYGATPCGAA